VVAVRRPAAGHRMTEDDQQNQNPRGPLFALAAVVVIFVLGLLLFRTLYTSRRLEDCFLSGRTNCAPIESPSRCKIVTKLPKILTMLRSWQKNHIL
jgi:hypothetical protein